MKFLFVVIFFSFRVMARLALLERVFLVPSLHNPTTVTLSEERRQAIIRRHNVLIIEDDVFRPLVESSIPSSAHSGHLTMLDAI